MHIASINLRINVDVDQENSWVYRKQKMIDFIKEKDFDVIGCQEASEDMVLDLKEGLSNLYGIIFQPRDNRKEGTPILYKKEMVVLNQGTFWLSETPDQESIVEGSHFPRICTYARFKEFIFFNTHLDYVSDDVCLVQAQYLIENMNKLTTKEDVTIVTGDFNMYPGSKTIKYMKKHLKHDYQVNNQYQLTFHGYTDKVLGEPIDYIFHTKNMEAQPLVIHHNIVKGRYISDHYPISIIISKLKTQ